MGDFESVTLHVVMVAHLFEYILRATCHCSAYSGTGSCSDIIPLLLVHCNDYLLHSLTAPDPMLVPFGF